MDSISDSAQYIFNISPFLFKGLKVTFQIYFSTLILVIPLGAVLAIGKVKGPKIIQKILYLYTWVIRGTPLLLILFFFKFGLPIIGIKLSTFTAAVSAFVINYAAYLTEIFRAGLESIDRGQYEASKVLGFSTFKTMTRIIIPQTIRRVLPPTASEAINLVKDTALLAAIGIPDLLRAAKQIFTRDFNVTSFILVFAMYLFLSSILVFIFGKLEKKYSVYE